MAHLSTHVLDLTLGRPAANLKIDLYRAGQHVKTVSTNEDGRVADPLLSGDTIQTGTYELVFHAGAYFRTLGHPLTDPPFLDEVVIRFGIADAAGRYHVPLLLSPYGYSTYRDS